MARILNLNVFWVLMLKKSVMFFSVFEMGAPWGFFLEEFSQFSVRPR